MYSRSQRVSMMGIIRQKDIYPLAEGTLIPWAYFHFF
jgi:hypothetical protein